MTYALGMVPWFLAGAAMGVLYLRLVRTSVAALATGSGWFAATGPLALRAGMAVSVLGLAAQYGALPLIVTLAGFLAARTAVLGRTKET